MQSLIGLAIYMQSSHTQSEETFKYGGKSRVKEAVDIENRRNLIHITLKTIL